MRSLVQGYCHNNCLPSDIDDYEPSSVHIHLFNIIQAYTSYAVIELNNDSSYSEILSPIQLIAHFQTENDFYLNHSRILFMHSQKTQQTHPNLHAIQLPSKNTTNSSHLFTLNNIPNYTLIANDSQFEDRIHFCKESDGKLRSYSVINNTNIEMKENSSELTSTNFLLFNRNKISIIQMICGNHNTILLLTSNHRIWQSNYKLDNSDINDNVNISISSKIHRIPDIFNVQMIAHALSHHWICLDSKQCIWDISYKARKSQKPQKMYDFNERIIKMVGGMNSWICMDDKFSVYLFGYSNEDILQFQCIQYPKYEQCLIKNIVCGTKYDILIAMDNRVLQLSHDENDDIMVDDICINDAMIIHKCMLDINDKIYLIVSLMGAYAPVNESTRVVDELCVDDSEDDDSCVSSTDTETDDSLSDVFDDGLEIVSNHPLHTIMNDCNGYQNNVRREMKHIDIIDIDVDVGVDEIAPLIPSKRVYNRAHYDRGFQIQTFSEKNLYKCAKIVGEHPKKILFFLCLLFVSCLLIARFS